MYSQGRHVDILRRGAKAWYEWRKENPYMSPDLHTATFAGLDLREADLHSANLSSSDLTDSDLSGADLSLAHLNRTRFTKANLAEANLAGAHLEYADFSGANLCGAVLSSLRRAWMSDFSGADLTETDLRDANLATANLSGARLCRANLEGASLVETNLKGAVLRGCDVYGVSAWNVETDADTDQSLLHVRGGRYGEPIEAGFTVDGLELAQFINLLLNNQNIRRAIDTITSKAVLILGRFSVEQKAILDDVRDALKGHDYVPIMFDFPEPRSRDLDETVSILAYLARFVIVDLTDPRSVPHELEAIVPRLRVPVQPILRKDATGTYGMFFSLKKYEWVLPTYVYENHEGLLANLASKVIAPAEAKAQEYTEDR